MSHNIHAKEFIVGAAVGSMLGSVAALFLAPQSGEKLRNNVYDTYCNASDRAQNLADRGKCFVEGARKKARNWGLIEEEEEENTTRDLLIGGIVGGVLGAVVGLLIAPKSGGELRQDLVDTYEDLGERTRDFADEVSKKGKAFTKTARSKTNKWLNLAQEIVEDLTENVQEKNEDLIGRAKDLVNNSRVNEIIDWAALGYRMWQGAKSRR